MKQSEDPDFLEKSKELLQMYSEWQQQAEPEHPRAPIAGGLEDEWGACFILFRGNRADCKAAVACIKKRKMVNK